MQRRYILGRSAILMGLVVAALVPNPAVAQTPGKSLDDCDCAQRVQSCAGGGVIENIKRKYNDIDGVEQMDWDLKVQSYPDNVCAFVQVAIDGIAGAKADSSDMSGRVGIYRRVVVGQTTIKDWQTSHYLPRTLKIDGVYSRCHVCGSKAAAAAVAAAAAKAAAAKKAAEQAIVAEQRDQLLAKARALASGAGEQIGRAAAGAANRLSAGQTTGADVYQNVLDNQQTRAANASNQVLMGAITSMAAGVTAGRRGASSNCTETLARIRENERAYAVNASNPAANDINTAIKENTAANQQWFDSNCR